MTTTSNGPKFVPTNSFSELTHSAMDASLEVETTIAQYSVEGAALLNLSGISSDRTPGSRKEGCSYLTETLDIPPLFAYTLHGAKVFPGNIRSREGTWHSHGQLIVDKNNGLFSESYGVMDGGKTLPRELLQMDTTANRLILNTSVEHLPILTGEYLFLGSMHDHFGHFLVEGLSRLWILKYFKSEDISALKIIIYEPGLIPPAAKMLAYLGIDKSQITFLSSPCIVEKVIVPAVAYRTHFWARDCMNHVYDSIVSGALKEKTKEFPKKIFLSRNNVPSRKLSNEIELESLYRDAGYWVLRPEAIPIGDQIRIVANADSVAGCTGSNMYLCVFQKPGGNNHIYAPYDFNLKDDAMISKVRDSQLTYILGTQLKNDQWSVDTDAACSLLDI